jgi:cobalt-zinc-cadmium resistance protein CzcA
LPASVLNGVVLISVIEQWRSAGLNVLEAVKEGAMQRLLTVLMTALLAALG